MNILHTTDLHFNKKWFEWIATQQDKFDVFCISGDFLESSKDETLLEQIKWISNWIKKFNKPLFVCTGNHDIELDNEEWLNNIDTSNYYPDYVIKNIDGIKFGCYPYVGADGYYEFDECDVLITHVPPAKTKTSTNKDNNSDWGDKELYNAIKSNILNPNILLCGHMHRPVKIIDKLNSTTIYNPGVDKKSDTPNHHKIEI